MEARYVEEGGRGEERSNNVEREEDDDDKEEECSSLPILLSEFLSPPLGIRIK